MGGRPQAASLVQGLRPRNAPLQNHRSPTPRRDASSAAQLTWRLPTEYDIRLPESRRGLRAGLDRFRNWQGQCIELGQIHVVLAESAGALFAGYSGVRIRIRFPCLPAARMHSRLSRCRIQRIRPLCRPPAATRAYVRRASFTSHHSTLHEDQPWPTQSSPKSKSTPMKARE